MSVTQPFSSASGIDVWYSGVQQRLRWRVSVGLGYGFTSGVKVMDTQFGIKSSLEWGVRVGDRESGIWI